MVFPSSYVSFVALLVQLPQMVHHLKHWRWWLELPCGDGGQQQVQWPCQQTEQVALAPVSLVHSVQMTQPIVLIVWW
jgi:hypothetical protein